MCVVRDTAGLPTHPLGQTVGLCCRWCWGTTVVPARACLAEVRSPVQKKFLLEDMKKSSEKRIQAGLEARKKRY